MEAIPVSDEVMRSVFEETKTPFKYGVILRGEQGKPVDCPSVFRHASAWHMVYVCMNTVGYETHLARSDDLRSGSRSGRSWASARTDGTSGRPTAGSPWPTMRGVGRVNCSSSAGGTG
jgi:hypothetical protein